MFLLHTKVMHLFQDLCESEKEKLNSQLLSWLSVKINSLTLQVKHPWSWKNPDLSLKLLLPQKQEANTDHSYGLSSHLPCEHNYGEE